MKRFICMLLAILCAAFSGLAEDAAPFAPYALEAPEGAVLEEGEGSFAFVDGTARVVVQVIDRVPDADPAEAVLRMMTQFEPFAIIGEDVETAEGFVGVRALNEGKFGDGVDLTIVMILSDEGSLLILSAYDLKGDEEKALSLLDGLLASLTVDGAPVVIAKD